MTTFYLRLVSQPMQIRFEFRKARNAHSASTGTLYVVLTLNKIHYGPYTTGIQTTRALWDARFSPRPAQEVKNLKSAIDNCQSALESAHARLLYQMQQIGETLPVDGPMVMDALTPKVAASLQEIYTDFRRVKKSLIEPDRRLRNLDQISQATYDTYPKRWVMIQGYLNYLRRPALPVTAVDYPFAEKLKDWLLQQKQTSGKRYDTATINKVISLLKMLLTHAQKTGKIKMNPVSDYSCRGGSPANPKPLSEAQLVLLETADMPPVLRHQCDSWLVAAELCLHYADYMRLPTMRLLTGESGKLYYQHDRSKQKGTSLLQTVNVTPRAARLIAKYGGVEGLYYSSSAYFSKIMKKMARVAKLHDEAGVLIDLQFGQGRDTGLTGRAVQGANSVQLSKMGGWSKAAYADRYIGNALGIVDAFAAGKEPRPATVSEETPAAPEREDSPTAIPDSG